MKYKSVKPLYNNKKFKVLVRNTQKVINTTLHRIKALKDFTLADGTEIKKGDLGGWVESENNLSQFGNSWILGEARVFENAVVRNDAIVRGMATVCGNAQILHNARVFGNAWVHGDSTVSECSKIHGHSLIEGGRICGHANIYDYASVMDGAVVYGWAQVFGHAFISNGATVCDTVSISGYTPITDEIIVSGDAKIESQYDVIWFKNIWSSGRTFTYTRSNGKWSVGCFYGTGEELIKKAYKDSKMIGKCYEATVKYVEEIYRNMKRRVKSK